MRKPKPTAAGRPIPVPGYKPVALPAVRAAHLMLKSKRDAEVSHAQRTVTMRIVNQFDRDTD
ncbi:MULTISPECIES: hypothetical protein [unclassified Ensifer]|uniref:hypothetical protein n=1 Tax=unclassified Ensifer TaxID=2633371 RepID=UPI0011474903|nr:MULTISPECIES: hypothetical protein [unclassified Ensifer]